ncbi:MAG: hypothetical protein KF832_25795 [Caldilineaceae bacterium]|nr:hypothetical protein [Caldilineaceae bacterium]
MTMLHQWRQRYWLSWLLVSLLLLTGGAVAVVQAQSQICRDIGNITVCGDILDEFVMNGGGFRLRGNLRIGPKGAAPVVAVDDTGSIFDGTVLPDSITTASYFHFAQTDPNTGSTDFIIGAARFINDPTGLALFSTFVFDHPPAGGEVTAGRLFVDPTNRRIFLPAAGAVPVFTARGVKRNQAYKLHFVSRLGAETFYKDGGSVDELTKVNAEFDLTNKKFKATVPIALKIGDNAENPNLEVTLRAEYSDNGALTSATIDGFKTRLAGLLMEASGIVVKGKQGSAPAEFEAATVKVLKSDNPNVPNLDPTAASLIFQFTKLKYKNGEFSIGGVEVPIKNWEFGAAFTMINQTLGLVTEAGVQSIQIKSTMQFGSGSDADKLPVTIKIGRAQDGNGQFRPVFQAGLTNFSPQLGALKFKLQNALFIGDVAQDFWGLKATNVDLQWPPHLGGKTAAGVGDFQLGMGNNKQVKFKLGNGTVGLPEFENNIFRANLQATIGIVQETIVMTGTGTFAIKLPGNQNSAGVVGQAILRYNRNVTVDDPVVVAASPGALVCRNPLGRTIACPNPSNPPPPPSTALQPLELKLAGFEMRVAGFKFNVVNPRGLADGGFAVDTATLALPTGLSIQNNPSGGIQVQGLVVKGNGDITIQGGGFELPPVSIGSVQLVALRGNFAKLADGTYEFQAGGKLPLPGAETNGGITLNVVIRTTNTGNFAGMGVNVQVFSPPLPPIPLGGTGFNLTRVQGSFDLNNGTSTITLGVTAASQFGIPLGALGTLPVATTDGNITAQFNPFQFTGTMTLKVLIFQVASATVGIGAEQGFDGGQGLNAKVNVNAVVVKGEFRMRVGKGVPGDPNKRRFAAAADFDLGIVKNQFGTGLPPINLGGIKIGLHGGVFKDNNFSPARETIGIKGTYDGIVLNFGVFVDLQAEIGAGGFFKVKNLDKYVLIPAAAVRAAAAKGEAGYSSRLLSAEEIQALGLVVSADADGVLRVLQDVIPVQLEETTSLVVGITYASGAPLLRLRLPDNTELTPETVNGTTTGFLTATDETGTNAYFVVRGATPGQYQLLIDNAPAEYEDVSYTLNEAPTVAITSATCGGADLPGITVTCANQVAAAAVMVPAASGATVNWHAADMDTVTTTVAVGYVVDSGDPSTVNLADVTMLAEHLPLGNGTYTEDLTQIGSGSYRLVVMADDGENGTVFAVSDVVITVVDQVAPAIPTGLSAVPQAGELLVKWTQNSERDLSGYEIGFGVVNDPSQFVYSRNMGPKEVMTGTNNIVDAKLWGLDDNTTIFYGLRAYDTSGNYSAWTPLQSGTPWAIAPTTWTPIPGGQGTSAIEIGFAVPMQIETLETALTVKDASGNVIPGTIYLLTDFNSSKTVGVGFEPTTPLQGAITATLKGGAGGVRAEDGRTMGADYTWSFTLQPQTLYLPLVKR